MLVLKRHGLACHRGLHLIVAAATSVSVAGVATIVLVVALVFGTDIAAPVDATVAVVVLGTFAAGALRATEAPCQASRKKIGEMKAS